MNMVIFSLNLITFTELVFVATKSIPVFATVAQTIIALGNASNEKKMKYIILKVLVLL